MAFYKDMKHKTRQEKRVEAAARGGFALPAPWCI